MTEVTLNFREEPHGTTVVEAVGEIDMSNVRELDLALNTVGGANTVVDMRFCTYFDSTCLAVLVRHARRLHNQGKHFNVRPDRNGRRIIRLANLGELLGVAEAAPG